MAQEARRIAGALRAAKGVQFQSDGATKYRQRLTDRAGRADGTAHELEQAAQALYRHAEQVEARMQQLEKLERWFHDRVRDAQRVVHGAAHAAGQAADAAADAARREAQQLLNEARRAPAPGSPEWENFTRRLRV